VFSSVGGGSTGDAFAPGTAAEARRAVLTMTLAHRTERETSIREVEAQILLVEDDEDLAGVIMALLADHGLAVVHAITASDAVALGPQLRVDAVILDLHLPDVDGSWVVKELRRLDHFAHVPLVVYSASDVEKQHRRDLSLGTTVFLTKGRSGPEELRDRVLALTSPTAGR
jgi:DNA-binding response OmpR family regulator